MTMLLDGTRILIVDDDQDILSSMELAIRKAGATTSTASDGNSAISVARSFQPDAVVLDMMLPGRSGFLVLEKLHELDPRPRVIMVTANQGRRHMAYARSLGVDDYLLKPVSLELLIERISSVLLPATSEQDEGEVDDPTGSK